MKVISAGMPRTGSQSLGLALEILGHRTYTMGLCVQSYRELGAWARHAEGVEAIDFRRFFEGYGASVGLPACLFYEELMEAFPDALVVVSPRDPERWYGSFDRLRQMQAKAASVLGLLPRTRAMRRTLEGLIGRVFLQGDAFAGKDACIAAYHRHNQRVVDTVPPERLLVFTVDQGWEPLCAFLGVPVPDVPFPHINRSESVVKRSIAKALARDVAYAAAVLALTWLLWGGLAPAFELTARS